MQLRASFLNLQRRASATVADTGLSPLRDDDEAPVIRDLPDMYALGVASGHAQLLGELADALARDQAYLGGLSRAPPASPPDAARLVACEREYRALAARALLPLKMRADDSTIDRARLHTRYVLSLELKWLGSSIDERLDRGAPAVLRDPVNLEPPRLTLMIPQGD